MNYFLILSLYFVITNLTLVNFTKTKFFFLWSKFSVCVMLLLLRGFSRVRLCATL